MKFPKKDHLLTGTALPISAIKTADNPGFGEFLDLIPLGKWCAEAGIELIQILPVNDTGYETSPYSALSAFALHPVFIRLDALEGAGDFKKEIDAVKKKFQGREEAPHQEILGAKWEIFQSIFRKNFEKWTKDQGLENWIKANPWVIEYAVFCTNKARNDLKGWQSWASFRNPSMKEIKAFWEAKANQEETLFFAWLQYEGEKQFKAAAAELDKLGVALKGDLPILLNDDSADVWAHPELFDLSIRAGAPPLGDEPNGQNWGFPTYRWANHRSDGFSWWKGRLKQADKFYHAYRIDHVVGFFRIWGTPEANFTAVLGHFSPSQTLTRQQLHHIGFDDGRIQWLMVPHIPGHELRDRVGAEAETVIAKALVRVGAEDLFRFKPELTGEKLISQLELSDHAKNHLYQWFRNRTLLDMGDGTVLPSYLHKETRGWHSLNDGEKHAFGQLVHGCMADSEHLWEKQGEELMEVMKSTVPMLVCAEDLGSVPDCVPRVLPRKSILGLKIVRWAREWKHHGSPFIPLKSYPLLSVCTPAVHDTSTVRQWWEEEHDRDRFFREALQWEPVHGPYTESAAESVIRGMLEASSYLCIFQIQDLLAIKEAYRTSDPNGERVNLPGTVSGKNWCYKMKPSVESLSKDKEFTSRLAGIISHRQSRKAQV